MEKIKYILFTFLTLFLCILSVAAECTKEDLTIEQNKANNIKIIYKHLGEVTKEDGSKAYNEFLVTAKNVEEDQYIHLTPFTNNVFIEKDNTIQITLTSGKWEYNIYSSKCDEIIKTINVKLPRFNTYSLDPLCKDIDGDDFLLCSKYLEYEVNRETFERKIAEYKKTHVNKEPEEVKDNLSIKDIINKVLEFVSEYNLFIAGLLLIILIILLVIIVNKRKKKRNVLE